MQRWVEVPFIVIVRPRRKTRFLVRTYALAHLSDFVLLRDLNTLVARERDATAAVLAHIAEVDARRLYRGSGYPSMHAYCVARLRLSEDAANKRIRAARAARDFPAIFPALAEGRLHLSGIALLASHLLPDNAGELLAAAEHRTRSEIEEMLARRFPQADLPARIVSLAPPPSLLSGEESLSPGTAESAVAQLTSKTVGAFAEFGELAPGPVAAPRSKLKPLAPERYALQLTIGKETHDKLRHAQALLSHLLPTGDLAQLLDRALDALVTQLEKRKFAKTARARSARAQMPGTFPPT